MDECEDREGDVLPLQPVWMWNRRTRAKIRDEKSPMKEAQPSTSMEFTVGARSQARDKHVYPVTEESMSNRVALLISNIDYKDPFVFRPLAEKHEQDMEQVLTNLRYKVVKHRNISGKEIDDALMNFSKHPDLIRTDSVFVVVISCGERGVIYGTDWDEFQINRIFQHLDSKNCPALMNKPKIIIIIQVPRRDEEKSPDLPDESRRPDPSVPAEDLPEPKEADFCLLLSSPDMRFHGSAAEESLLLNPITWMFSTASHNTHVASLITKVRKRLRTIPSGTTVTTSFTLTKRFYFFPRDQVGWKIFPAVGAGSSSSSSGVYSVGSSATSSASASASAASSSSGVSDVKPVQPDDYTKFMEHFSAFTPNMEKIPLDMISREQIPLAANLSKNVLIHSAETPIMKKPWSSSIFDLPAGAYSWALDTPVHQVYPVTEESMSNRVALLINNIDYKDPFVFRPLAEKHEQYMEQVLTNLRYKLVKHRNLAGKEIDDALMNFSKHPDLIRTDSVFVVVMSCGKRGVIYGTDRDEFQINRIFQHLGSKNCPALANKPKIIIIITRARREGMKKVFQCKLCSYTCRLRSNLKSHMRRSHGERPFTCPLCGMSLATVTQLTKHMYTHTGSPPHKHAAFLTSRELFRKHKHEKGFEFSSASREVSKLELPPHSKTEEGPFQCSHCSYASTDTNELKRHLKTHSDEEKSLDLPDESKRPDSSVSAEDSSKPKEEDFCLLLSSSELDSYRSAEEDSDLYARITWVFNIFSHKKDVADLFTIVTQLTKGFSGITVTTYSTLMKSFYFLPREQVGWELCSSPSAESVVLAPSSSSGLYSVPTSATSSASSSLSAAPSSSAVSDVKPVQPDGEKKFEKHSSTFTPKLETESWNMMYSFRCPGPGEFQCSLTGLVFVMTQEAELQYRTTQWPESLIQSACKTPAGLLFNIKCCEDAVRQLHLPHCETEDAAFSEDLLSVVHISDDNGMSVLQPVKITDTHVIVDVSHLSAFGLVWDFKRFLGIKKDPVRGQVLLFLRPPNPKTKKQNLNVFLMPSNIPVEEVKVQQKLSDHIQTPSYCKLVPDQAYTVQCPKACKIQPEKADFFLEFGPNYHPTFEIRLPINTEEATVAVQDPTDGVVWKHEVDLTEPVQRDVQVKVKAPAEFYQKTKKIRTGLVSILDRLDKDTFNRFKWHLKDDSWNITEKDLTDTKREDVVTLMVQRFDFTGAVQVMERILEDMKMTKLVEELRQLRTGDKDQS